MSSYYLNSTRICQTFLDSNVSGGATVPCIPPMLIYAHILGQQVLEMFALETKIYMIAGLSPWLLYKFALC